MPFFNKNQTLLLNRNYEADRAGAHAKVPVFFDARNATTQANLLLLGSVLHESNQFVHKSLALVCRCDSARARKLPWENPNDLRVTDGISLGQGLANLPKATDDLILRLR
jgi:hypothetical protein